MKPVVNLCLYRVKKGKESEFASILEKHWPALRKAGLATDRRPTVWRSQDKDGKTTYVELFEWNDTQAVGAAHTLPEVMAVWEPMGALTEGMEFLEVEPVHP